jgi:uncharacterized membrane-anchored protein
MKTENHYTKLMVMLQREQVFATKNNTRMILKTSYMLMGWIMLVSGLLATNLTTKITVSSVGTMMYLTGLFYNFDEWVNR